MFKFLQNIAGNISRFFKSRIFKNRYKKTTTFIKQNPFRAFFIVLGLLFLLIIIGNLLTSPVATKEIAPLPKKVSVYQIGKAQTVLFQAKVEKAGVVKIVALSQGIVQNINVQEGGNVYQGQTLLSLSSNYQGGNAPAVQAEIAEKQYQITKETYDAQKDAINKQRDIANLSHDNFTSTQDSLNQSEGDTNNLITANQSVLDTLNAQLAQDKATNADPTKILGEEEQINGFQAAQNQLKQESRNLDQTTDPGKPQTALADRQRDLLLRQLDIQEKSLDLGLEIGKLMVELAQINAASMFPASPFTGIVQRIYVQVGDQVNSGTTLALVSSNAQHASAIVDVPQDIVSHMSQIEPSVLNVSGKQYEIRPVFVPTEPTNGTLYSIKYALPSDVVANVFDGQYLTIAIPVGNANTSAAVPFIPLDAIYQTQDNSYLLVIKNKKAVAQTVTVGSIVGNFAQITQGLTTGDQIITERDVQPGDSVLTY